MRICSLSNAYLPHAGGIEVLLDATCGPLLADGNDLLIVTGDGGSPPHGDLTDDEWLRPTPGVTVERLNIHGPIAQRDVRGIHRLQKQLSSVLGEFQPDIVHAHDVGPLLWLYLQAARRLPPRPLIVTLHTLVTQYDELTAGAVRATGGLIGHADVITGVSRHVVEDILTFAPEVADRVVHLPNGIVPPKVITAPIDRDRVTSIGRLVPYKDLDLAIGAFAVTHRQRPSARLDIYGEGPLAEDLRNQIAAVQLNDVVRLMGRRSHEEVLMSLARSSCLLMSSKFEGLPLVALEAGWAGRPVVAFDAPGVSEAVVHGQTGILVPPGDVEALGSAVTDLIDDPERADHLGANGRIRAQREYDIDRYVDDLELLFTSTIEEFDRR